MKGDELYHAMGLHCDPDGLVRYSYPDGCDLDEADKIAASYARREGGYMTVKEAEQAERKAADPEGAIEMLIAATLERPRRLPVFEMGSNAGGGGGLSFVVPTPAADRIVASLQAAGARADSSRYGDKTIIAVKQAVRVNQNDSGVGSWPGDGPTWSRFAELVAAAGQWGAAESRSTAP